MGFVIVIVQVPLLKEVPLNAWVVTYQPPALFSTGLKSPLGVPPAVRLTLNGFVSLPSTLVSDTLAVLGSGVTEKVALHVPLLIHLKPVIV